VVEVVSTCDIVCV
jgi:hypothetical protein